MVLADGRVVEFGSRNVLANDPDSQYSALLRMSAEAAGEADLDERLEEMGR